MSIVDLSVVDKKTRRPVSRPDLENYLNTLCEDINPIEGDDSRHVSYAIDDGDVIVEYLRRQTFVSIISSNGVADKLRSNSPFDWYLID